MASNYIPNLGEIPQFSTDPASPTTECAWVLKSGGGTGGGKIQAFLGLGFPYLSINTGGVSTYALKYRTKEGTTISTALS
jgi:hypothetical protein